MQNKPVIKDRYKSLTQISEEIFMTGMNEITWSAQPENQNIESQKSNNCPNCDEFTAIVTDIKNKLDQLLGQLNCNVETPEFEFNKANTLSQLVTIQNNIEDIVCNLSASSHSRMGVPMIISVPIN